MAARASPATAAAGRSGRSGPPAAGPISAAGARGRPGRLVGELRRPLIEERLHGLGGCDARSRHDLLAVLVLDRRLLTRDLERGPHSLLGEADAPGGPGGDLLRGLERAGHDLTVLDHV